jgi:hypothetical protein
VMARSSLLLKFLCLLYASSAFWCITWITEADANDAGFFMPATGLAALAVPIAFGLMRAKKVAYYLFYAHVVAWVAIGLAITGYIKHHREWVYFAIAHVVVVAVLFLPGRVRGLFFVMPSAMRTAARHDINLNTFIEAEGARRTGETVDLSQGGAFISVPTEGLSVGQRVVVQMHLRANKFLRLPAHVKSVNAQASDQNLRGIGVSWSHLTDHDKENIDHFMAEGRRMNKMQTPLKLSASFAWEQRKYTCDLYGLTGEGCYLDDKDHVLQPGDQVALTIHLHEGDTIEVVSEVKWLPGDATIVAVTNIIGSALEFRGLSKKDAQRIEERIAQGDGASS